MQTENPYEVCDYPPLPAYQPDSDPEKKEVYIVQAKGFPWTCSAEDLLHFFSECRIRNGTKGIHLTVNRLGRPTGQAFIEMEHEVDVSKALEKHRDYIGTRYVEVYEVTDSDAEAMLNNSVQTPDGDGVVRLRGLPFSCTEAEIRLFFAEIWLLEDIPDSNVSVDGSQVVQADRSARERGKKKTVRCFPNNKPWVTSDIKASSPGAPQQYYRAHFTWHTDLLSGAGLEIAEDRVTIVLDHKGRNSGEAYVQFASQQTADEALQRDRELIGNRYIELFPSRSSQIQSSWRRTDSGSPQDRKNIAGAQPNLRTVNEVTDSDAEAMLIDSVQTPDGDGVVRLRGLPFSCTEADIRLFFAGLEIAEDGVTIVLDHKGRNSGEAYVQFTSQQTADEALQRDRELIGNRYIELFPSRSSEIQSSWRRTDSGSPQHRKSIAAAQPNPRTDLKWPPVRTGPQSSALSQHHVHLRGLPFHAAGQDIAQFFCPLVPSKILVEFGPDGRATGEAEVYFACHQDAVSAMSRNKLHMGERYIELFLNSVPDQ
ncbi:G-rich sequence factor 1 [Diretmus argenteus]